MREGPAMPAVEAGVEPSRGAELHPRTRAGRLREAIRQRRGGTAGHGSRT